MCIIDKILYVWTFNLRSACILKEARLTSYMVALRPMRHGAGLLTVCYGFNPLVLGIMNAASRTHITNIFYHSKLIDPIYGWNNVGLVVNDQFILKFRSNITFTEAMQHFNRKYDILFITLTIAQ